MPTGEVQNCWEGHPRPSCLCSSLVSILISPVQNHPGQPTSGSQSWQHTRITGEFYKKSWDWDCTSRHLTWGWARAFVHFTSPHATLRSNPSGEQKVNNYFLLPKFALPSPGLWAGIPYSALFPLFHLVLPLHCQDESLHLLWTSAHTSTITLSLFVLGALKRLCSSQGRQFYLCFFVAKITGPDIVGV